MTSNYNSGAQKRTKKLLAERRSHELMAKVPKLSDFFKPKRNEEAQPTNAADAREYAYGVGFVCLKIFIGIGLKVLFRKVIALKINQSSDIILLMNPQIEFCIFLMVYSILCLHDIRGDVYLKQAQEFEIWRF